MRDRMSWNELVKTYPDSWVVLNNVTFADNEHCMFVESGEFVKTVSAKDAADVWENMLKDSNGNVLVFTGNRHVRALTKPCSRMQWDDIEREFPDMWVALLNAEHVNNDKLNANIVSGIVVCSALDDQIDDFWAVCDDYNDAYYVMRTSDNFPTAFVGLTA